MDSQTSLSDDREILPNVVDKAPSAVAIHQAPAENDDVRFKCIRAYEELSLQQSDPLRACLGLVNCGLMELTDRYHIIIRESFSNRIQNLSDLRQLSYAMDGYLKLVRQTDRFAQMEIRLREAEKRSDANEQLANCSNAGLVPMQSEETTV